MISLKTLAPFGALTLAVLLSVFVQGSPVEADFDEVQISQVMAGAFGNDDLEFVELRMLSADQNCQASGNNGNGRTRCWHWTDSIQQLQGRAGKRQIQVKAETAMVGIGGPLPTTATWAILSINPD